MTQSEPWVEVRRFDDPIAAEMASDFLREHDITVGTRGNSGATSMLNRFVTFVDIRLVVPASQAEEAREALAALEPGDGTVEQPFRGAVPARVVDEPDDAMPAPKSKRAWLIALVATFVPAAAMVAGGTDEGRSRMRRHDDLRVEQLDSVTTPGAGAGQGELGPLRPRHPKPAKATPFAPAEGRGNSTPP